MPILKQCLIALLTLMISACASTPAPDNTNHKDIPWATRAKQLKRIHNWTITGSLSIKKDNKIQPIVFINTWQQRNKEDYTIDLSGVAGLKATTITGKPGLVTLSGDKQGAATTPEELMQEQLGYSLPLSPLYDWIRGLPSSRRPIKEESFDAYHHLNNLHEAGWTVRYLGYTCEQGIDLPSLMTLDNKNKALHIKIAISSWKLMGIQPAPC